MFTCLPTDLTAILSARRANVLGQLVWSVPCPLSLSRSRRSHSSPRLGKELSEQEESECECVREG